MPTNTNVAPVFVRDVLVSISLGTTNQAGATPMPATPSVAYECKARSVSISLESRTVDLSTLCSAYEEPFETRKGGTVNIELFVDKVAGPLFLYKTGFLASVKVVLGTTSGSTCTYTGLITATGLSETAGEVQVETVTLTIGGYGNTGGIVAA